MAKDKEALSPLPTPDPLTMLSRMVEQGTAPESLAKMLDLVERWQASEAKKKYTAAIVAFKKECPTILKKNPVRGRDKTDASGAKIPKSGDVHYHFASYDEIKAVTVPLEQKNDITTSFDFEVTGAGNLVGTLLITVGSHTESRKFGVPVPKGLNTNNAQDFGGAMTYLRRYLYTAAFDLVIAGEDRDGQGLADKITPEQIGELNDLIAACEKAGKPVTMPKFKAWLEIEELDELSPSGFEKAKAELKRKVGAK